jgi:hypothetical protein
MTASRMPTMMPGTMPAIRSLPIEVCVAMP